MWLSWSSWVVAGLIVRAAGAGGAEPRAEGGDELGEHAEADGLDPEPAGGGDRGTQLTEVLPAGRAPGQMALERAPRTGVQGILQVVGDQLHDVPAGEVERIGSVVRCPVARCPVARCPVARCPAARCLAAPHVAVH